MRQLEAKTASGYYRVLECVHEDGRVREET